MVLLDEEFGNGLTGWSWFLGSVMRLRSRCQIGLHPSEGLSGAEGSIFKSIFGGNGFSEGRRVAVIFCKVVVCLST